MVKKRVDDLWATIPGGAVLVCAGVLVAGAPAVASAQREDSQEVHAITWVVGAMTPRPMEQAPTCGPCCHGMPSCEQRDLEPDRVDTATTGEDKPVTSTTTSTTTHGGDPNEQQGSGGEGPPAIATSGCTVMDSGGELPVALGLLGVGALVARRRRNNR